MYEPDGRLAGQRTAHNLMTTNGLAAIAQALAYSGVQDIGFGLGASPFYLSPLWGAVGTSSTTPAAGDTLLGAEAARGAVATVGNAGAEAIWDFLFGAGALNTTITEAGLFAQASSTAGSGTLIDHALFASGIAVASTQVCTLQATFAIAQG